MNALKLMNAAAMLAHTAAVVQSPPRDSARRVSSGGVRDRSPRSPRRAGSAQARPPTESPRHARARRGGADPDLIDQSVFAGRLANGDKQARRRRQLIDHTDRSICVVTMFLWKPVKINVEWSKLVANVTESPHIDLRVFGKEPAREENGPNEEEQKMLRRIRSVHGKLFEAETSDEIDLFFESLKKSFQIGGFACVPTKVEVVYEEEFPNPQFDVDVPADSSGSDSHSFDIAGKCDAVHPSTGGLWVGDRVLKMLEREVDQKLTLDNIDKMTVEEAEKAKRVVTTGKFDDCSSMSGKLLFIVSRKKTCLKTESKSLYCPVVSEILNFACRGVMTPLYLAQVLYAISETPEEEPKDLMSVCKRNKVEIGASLVALFTMLFIMFSPSWVPVSQEDGEQKELYQVPSDEAETADTDLDGVAVTSPLTNPSLSFKGHTILTFNEISWETGDDTQVKESAFAKTDIMDHAVWSKLELTLLFIGLTVAMAFPFLSLLKKLEHAGRTGNAQEVRFGSATFIALGMIGKILRTGVVATAFSDLPTATAFFIFQEIGVIGLTCVFSLFSGVLGLDFRPTNWLSAWLYCAWIVVEVALKCWVTFLLISWYKGIRSTAVANIGWFRNRLMNLNLKSFLIFFVAMHLTLDTAQQIITGLAGDIAGQMAQCIKRCGVKQCLPEIVCSKVTPQFECHWFVRSILVVIPQGCEWIAHFGLTLPVLEGGWGPLYVCRRVMKADKAAAGHVASEMLRAQLNGVY